jgi:hypothetical protein
MLEMTARDEHAKGLEQGLEQSHKKILDVARSLKKAGLPDSEIAAHIGLSQEEISILSDEDFPADCRRVDQDYQPRLSHST